MTTDPVRTVLEDVDCLETFIRCWHANQDAVSRNAVKLITMTIIIIMIVIIIMVIMTTIIKSNQ